MALFAFLNNCVAIDVPSDPLSDVTVVSSNRKFTFEYFKASYDWKTNYVTSPYHVRLALSMFYPIAGAAVQEDFCVAFNLPEETKDAVDQQCRLTKEINDGTHVKALSFVLVEETKQLSEDFERLFQRTYDTTVEAVDLTDDIPSAAAVNSFYRMANTEIEDFICEGDVFSLEPCFTLMLFSGVSILTPLCLRFNPADTKMDVFRFINAPEQRVPLMRATASLPFCQHNELKCSAVDIPFDEASGLSLLLILPNEGTELREVVSRMNEAHLKQIEEFLRPTITTIVLPKFFVREKTESKTILAKLGYGGIFEIKDLRVFKEAARGLLNGFFQHCYISIGENGNGHLPNEPESSSNATFNANRPFMFFVRRLADGQIFQIGHFSKYIDPDEQW
ncbi:intracellular coagulation inhibitor 2-like [Anopheles ziemanni]|uniref:intracellular coagulation inhibitor 2-like n=1 Tax=Anopheles coustani TaxID=139045 RepID=UPI00265A0BD0|nr:intracellular coagulation inhibitor 2-like [Anopheles coustani]XP_058168854.1 intracellular coagulation inhibitor 2-like [Anopheles ziemanni]